jgi:hypothetical protein
LFGEERDHSTAAPFARGRNFVFGGLEEKREVRERDRTERGIQERHQARWRDENRRREEKRGREEKRREEKGEEGRWRDIEIQREREREREGEIENIRRPSEGI